MLYVYIVPRHGQPRSSMRRVSPGQMPRRSFGAADVFSRAYPIRMSARDLARFALLYLNSGSRAGRQLVPAEWVKESTRPYSRSGFGPAYGYLWWTGTSDDTGISRVRLLEGSFFALGAGGQYAFIIPADDIVVMHRVDRDQQLAEPGMSMVVLLLDMILTAGGFKTE